MRISDWSSDVCSSDLVFEHRGRQVGPAAITDVGLLAVEGERDDISGLGQTKAALTIATHLPEELKRYYMAEGVGHYGIFNGSKWRTRIAPDDEEWIAMQDAGWAQEEKQSVRGEGPP